MQPSGHFQISQDQYSQMLLALRSQQDLECMDFTFQDDRSQTVTNHKINFRRDPNKIADNNGNTWLHIGVLVNSERMVEGFLQHGENLNLEMPNRDGYNPLMLAVQAGRKKMVEAFVEKGANILARNEVKRRNVLEISMESGDLTIFLLLLEKGANVNNSEDQKGAMTPLHLAAFLGNVDFVRNLLKQGARIEQASYITSVFMEGYTIHDDLTPLFCAALSKNATSDLVSLLVCAGDDPKRVLKDQSNILHFAANNNPVLCRFFLTEYKVNPNQINNEGNLPFHRACDNQELIDCFLEHQVSPNSRVKDDLTLLGYFCQLEKEWFGNMIIKLLQLGADPNLKSGKLDSLTILFKSIKEKKSLCITEQQLLEIIDLFIKKGCKIEFDARQNCRECECLSNRDQLGNMLMKASDCNIL